jgi:hypothetical protein
MEKGFMLLPSPENLVDNTLSQEQAQQPQAAPEESWLGGATRNIARGATNLASDVMGFPGVVVGAMESGVRAAQAGLSELTGGYIPEPINKERVNPFLLPEEFKRDIGKASKGYLEPKTEREKWIDKKMSSVAPWLVGGWKAAIAPIATGEIFRYGAKYLGKDEKTQDNAEAIGQLTGSLLNVGGLLNKAISSGYKKAAPLLPPGALGDFAAMHGETEGFIENLKKTATGHPEQEAAIAKAESLINPKNNNLKLVKTSKGDIYAGKIEDIANFQKSVNRLASKNPEMLGLSNVINNGLETTAGKHYTDWLKEYRMADKLHSIKMEQTALGKIALNNKAVKKVMSDPIMSSIFGVGALGGAAGTALYHGLPLTAIASRAGMIAGGAVAVGKIHKAIDMIVRHPEISKMYMDVYKYGLLNDVPKLLSSLTGVQKAISGVTNNSATEKGFILLEKPTNS